MFDSNQITHWVFWPQVHDARLVLVSPHGEEVGFVEVTEPRLGAEMAKRVPEGYKLEPVGCVGFSLSGEPIVGGDGKFDTCVVTERAVVTDAERFEMLVKLDRRRAQQIAAVELAAAKRDKEQAELMRQNSQLQAELEAARALAQAQQEETPEGGSEIERHQQEEPTDVS